MELAYAQAPASAGLKDYVTLLKPRVMSLALFTGMVGMELAPGHLPVSNALWVMLSLALGGGAAGALNMWLERDRDALMERTKHRPLPAGRISPDTALRFALLCAGVSIAMMAQAANIIAAALLLGTIVFYAVVYTVWLKPRTPMNIVIGGAAGALPPVIGWAAVTGNVSLEPIILFMIIFLWTPPHFWALALLKSDDYRNAGIPMLPVTAGREATIRQMLIYSLLLFPFILLPYALGMAGLPYAAGASILGFAFIGYAISLWYSQDLKYAMPMFTYSLLYLAGIFTLLLLDKVLYGV
ncbi:MAG TPA: heme o synthase [Rickettsiales bacterium]|nr:heme o synthase [Rickettsiales bacterium]